MTQEEIYTVTQNNYVGNWTVLTTELGDINLHITKNENVSEFKLSINNHVEEFSSAVHWFGPFLLAVDKAQYFIRFADENHLVFGKNSGTADWGDVVWQYKFTRVM